MAESQNQGEKARKPRPFGSFLLFLTIIVVVLVAFGGADMHKPKTVTRDKFLQDLVAGDVRSIDIKADGTIVGELYPSPEELKAKGHSKATGKRFKTLDTDAADNAALYQEWNAKARYESISAGAFLAAVENGQFVPEEAWHVRTSHDGGEGELIRGQGQEPTADSAEPGTPQLTSNPTVGARTDPSLTEQYYVFGVARGGFSNDRTGAASFTLKQGERSIGLKVENVQPQLVELDQALHDVETRDFYFDVSEKGGTRQSPAEGSLFTALMLWGPWLLIFAVFLFFMRQMRNQGSGAGVMSFGRSRAQMYTKENDTGVTFDDVAGAQEAKAEVHEVVEFLKNPGRFTRIG